MRIRETLAFSVALTAPTLLACGPGEPEEVHAARREFQEACPKPGWWDRVSTDVEIRTYDELLEYWRDEDRSKSQFFKAAYRAILDYPLDTTIVLTTLNLMPNVASDYGHLVPCLEFAVDRHFAYDRPLGNYSGKPGDTMGGIVEDLSSLYNRHGQYEKSIMLLQRFLEEREAEVNDHILEFLALNHARALKESGRDGEAIATLRRAIDRYDGSWEERLRTRLAEYEHGS